MPLVLPDGAPYPNAVVGWTGVVWRCLHVDAAGDLQIDILSTVMDAAAATAANQALILAQLQLIEDMRDALQSVNTDALQVRGEDQLFSLDLVVGLVRTAAISGANGYVDSNPVPDNMYWKITNVVAYNFTTATTYHSYYFFHDGVAVQFDRVTAAFGIGVPSIWKGELWMDGEDVIRVNFQGGLVGDNCSVRITGFQMSAE